MLKGLVMRSLLIAVFAAVITNPDHACTIISAADGQTVLFGNNEDWSSTDPIVGFVPADGADYGYMVFAWKRYYPAYPQGGMNDQGLSLDWAMTPQQHFQNDPHKPLGEEPLLTTILRTCSTVDAALVLLMAYNWPNFQQEHLLIADRLGNSAIVEWGDTGLVAIPKERYYQVATNFNLTNPDTGWYPCQRYNQAEAMFANGHAGVSVELLQQVLEATHSEGEYPTVYSNINNLHDLTVTVFYRHQFDRSFTIDLREELQKGAHILEIVDQLEPKH